MMIHYEQTAVPFAITQVCGSKTISIPPQLVSLLV